ncbi:NAD(P)H nitroreductase [Paractinoplanes ferrugineus]|uniref:NAD(P)H nitroreductase n=1 Tax=Paractinoplanes ferrugineus TaxID=113564 RepID=A0A919J2P5_9ACTN|nr:nitroreductase family protein [Actinoplanes ferrugineus]GIE11379.1 putative NAD(P)H nitroreductase [Actinoplanes ferrugineus]
MTAEIDRRPALRDAADAARYAPSIHNTQPWKWTVHPDRLELHAVTGRQLAVQDPDGHMLLLSCGAALHHARVALAAAGWQVRVERPAGDPLAVLHADRQGAADPAAVELFEQVKARHTDRRTVGDTPLAPAVLDDLVAATERAGARLHLVGRDQLIDLAVIVERAQKTESADERLQEEIAEWVGGERSGGTGIPAANLPAGLPLTTVQERDFGTAGTLPVGEGHDSAATYAVLYGTGDDRVEWLRAGEALNALWVAATAHGAGVLPLSSPIEVGYTRLELRRLIGDLGAPYLVLRLGVLNEASTKPSGTPRLPVDQVIDEAP